MEEKKNEIHVRQAVQVSERENELVTRPAIFFNWCEKSKVMYF